MKSATKRYGLFKRFVGMVFIFYVMFFTPFGAMILPYFTSMGEWDYYDHRFIGSGFYVNPHYIVTNKHVVEGCPSIKIRDAGGVKSAYITASNQTHDLAVLRVRGESNIFAVFRQERHKAGETVIFADYTSKAGKFALKSAEVLPDEITNQSSLWFSNRIKKGNSGAPVMDERGYLLGMVRSYNYTGINPLFPKTVYNSAVAINALKYFLYRQHIMYYELPEEDMDLFEDTLLKEQVAVGILCAHKGRRIYLSY